MDRSRGTHRNPLSLRVRKVEEDNPTLLSPFVCCGCRASVEEASIKRLEFVGAALEKHGVAIVLVHLGAPTSSPVVRVIQWYDNRKNVEAARVDMPRAVLL